MAELVANVEKEYADYNLVMLNIYSVPHKGCLIEVMNYKGAICSSFHT